MTFCSQCGVECVANAKFCHSCEISQQRPRNATATSSANSTPSTSGSTLTHINSNRSRLPFGAYRTCKEVERSSCFKPKGPNPKKMKTQSTAKVTVDVKVNVGIVTFRDEKMLPRRNTTLPLTVKDTVEQADKPDSDKPVVLPATVPPATAPPATVPSATVPPATQPQTVQCPLCIEHFPVEEIEAHADECCMWLLNEDIQEAASPVNVSEQFREEQTAYNY